MDEELMAKQPPQSLEAEQAVLGSILIDSRCLTDVVGIVTPEDFFLKQNREIFETIYTMFNFSQTIDPVTVLDKMKELGVYQDNSRDYVLQLMEITPTAANVVRYANIVREKAMLRGLLQAGTDIAEMVHEEVGTASEMLEGAEKKIYALRRQLADKHISFLELLDRLLQVDDIDAVSFSKDVLLHLGVPSSGVVSEMNTCFKQLLDGNDRHFNVLLRFFPPHKFRAHHPIGHRTHAVMCVYFFALRMHFSQFPQLQEIIAHSVPTFNRMCYNLQFVNN